MIGWPSVHLCASVQSSDEKACGVSSARDVLDVSVLHRGNTTERLSLRLTAQAFTDGSLRLSVRQILSDGKTKLIGQVETGELSEDESPFGVIDLTELVPLPSKNNLVRKAKA